MATEKFAAFQPMPGIYEPSGIQQLPDGRFLVVEDEKDHALSLVTIGADGVAASTGLTPGLFQMFSAFWALDDLEGLALDHAGYLYAITSHSRNEQGERKKEREKLARFRIDGEKVVRPLVVDGLKAALEDAHPVLAAAAKIKEAKTEGGLNIEALEISPDQQKLLVGFRSPLQGGRAIIASVDNIEGVFEAEQKPEVASRLDTLDLDGNGIRGMSYIAALAGYLVIGGPVSRAPGPFGLWFWSGQPGAPARRVTVTGLAGLERAEGVSPAVIDGVERIVVVSDDGDRKKKRPASFLLLDPDQLWIAP